MFWAMARPREHVRYVNVPNGWSFYRLARFIEYKAILEGITVEYVDPRYTSQTCPDCGTSNKANGRKYKCGCGFKKHRDMVGAINIISSTCGKW